VASGFTAKGQLRAQFVHNGLFEDSSDPSRPAWVLDTPYEVRDAAVCDFVKAATTNRKLIREGKRAATASVGFRSKKDKQQSFVVGFRAYYKRVDSSFSIFPASWKSVDPVIRARESLPLTLLHDSRFWCARDLANFICAFRLTPQPMLTPRLSRSQMLCGTITKSRHQQHSSKR
jgi:hypothetical protein